MIPFPFRRNNCLFVALIVVFVNLISFIGAKDINTYVSTTERVQSSSTESSEIELEQFKTRNFECNVHENCTSRLFSLDTYCCMPANYCCNWFEFMMKFKSNSATTLPYKSPSLVTIFTLLILIICFLFISYCISILFCYYFKCGLFKKPKVLVISSSSSSRGGYRHRRNYAREFDSTSTEIIHQQPKTSSNESRNSSRRTSHSSSSLSSASSSYSITQHRSNLQSKLKSKKSSSVRNQNEPKTPIDAKNYKRTRTNRDEFISRSVDNYPQNKQRALASNRTASSSSKRTRQQPLSRRQQQSLYADPECYIDYENESPFLLPSKRSSSTTAGATSSYLKTKHSNSSVASSSKHQINKRRRTSSNNTRQNNTPSLNSNTKRTSPRRSTSNNSQHNPRRSSASDHSYGTAVALVDIDLLGNATSRLETVEASSASSSRHSSLSRLSGSSEVLASLAGRVGDVAANTAHVRVTQQSIGIDLMGNNSDTEINASTLLLSTAGTTSTTVPSYYQDEKPPSYDDIIRQNI